MLESDILYKAIERLEQLMQVQVEVVFPERNSENYPWDATIKIKTASTELRLNVAIKGDVLPSKLYHFMDVLKAKDTLLVANYMSEPVKELMRQQGVNYLDTAGNCLIRQNGIYWYFKGQGTTLKNAGKIKHRAFQKNGIKLIYALLVNDALLNKTYRDMATEANISMSTIGDILSDLKALKFLVQINKNTMKLVNKVGLLEQWVTAYNRTLKPKLMRGRYRLRVEAWSGINLGPQSFWSGEPAGDLLVNYLYPSHFTIFSDLDRKKLITELPLLPDDEQGNVEIYTPFWSSENIGFVVTAKHTVHPLLVYADLIGSGNDRNFETAQKIYEQYIKNHLN